MIRLHAAIVPESELYHLAVVHVHYVAVVGPLEAQSECSSRIKLPVLDLGSLLLVPGVFQPTVATQDVLAVLGGIEARVKVEVDQRMGPDLAGTLQIHVEGIR